MRRGTLRVLLVGLLLAGCAQTAPVPSPPPRPLRVLLTNDDGYDAPGLRALREALAGSSHHVTVVAPSRDRSGSSVALTTRGELSLQEVEPGVWAVGGTPADCVHVALDVVLEERPDLVISGVNLGQNVGSRTVASGTVGAAAAASMLGVPAIAVSQAVEPRNVELTPRYFPDAAALTATLVDALVASGADPLLPRATFLNVNHPPRHASELAGVMITRQGRGVLYRLRYERQPSGTVSVGFERTTSADRADADTTALSAGYVSITPLDGDWNVPEEAPPYLRGVAERLWEAIRAPAPRSMERHLDGRQRRHDRPFPLVRAARTLGPIPPEGRDDRASLR